jgi:hypothetical protein
LWRLRHNTGLAAILRAATLVDGMVERIEGFATEANAALLD